MWLSYLAIVTNKRPRRVCMVESGCFKLMAATRWGQGTVEDRHMLLQAPDLQGRA